MEPAKGIGQHRRLNELSGVHVRAVVHLGSGSDTVNGVGMAG